MGFFPDKQSKPRDPAPKTKKPFVYQGHPEVIERKARQAAYIDQWRRDKQYQPVLSKEEKMQQKMKQQKEDAQWKRMLWHDRWLRKSD